MKTKIAGIALLLLGLGGLRSFGQTQNVLDLLRALQPGAPATAPAAAPATQPAPAPGTSPTPAPGLDTKAVYMSIVTNSTRITNQVIVTNYVVVTNITFVTNFYNAQGQLLSLVPGATPIVVKAEPKPAAPDPAVIRSNQVQAIRDLLNAGMTGVSNTLAASGSFTGNPRQIRLPEGVTVLDRKKGQTLVTAMNATAEKVIPGACGFIQKAAAQLNPPDPAGVLKGGNDAATRFLLTQEGQNISNQILSLVTAAAPENHLSEAYNAVMLRGGGLLGAVLGTAPSVDINAHVTKGVMEAIFVELSSEENQIRTNPNARKTGALREVFAK